MLLGICTKQLLESFPRGVFIFIVSDSLHKEVCRAIWSVLRFGSIEIQMKWLKQGECGTNSYAFS